MQLFIELSEQQEQDFRQWARDNYYPFMPINGCWHPVIQDECRVINASTPFEPD